MNKCEKKSLNIIYVNMFHYMEHILWVNPCPNMGWCRYIYIRVFIATKTNETKILTSKHMISTAMILCEIILRQIVDTWVRFYMLKSHQYRGNKNKQHIYIHFLDIHEIVWYFFQAISMNRQIWWYWLNNDCVYILIERRESQGKANFVLSV